MDWNGFSVLFCMPRLCSPRRSLRVRPVCPMYCKERVVSFFNHHLQIAVNHVNQVIRRTRQILMDSSGFVRYYERCWRLCCGL